MVVIAHVVDSGSREVPATIVDIFDGGCSFRQFYAVAESLLVKTERNQVSGVS